MNYRSPALLSAVRQLPCTWPLPHTCGGAIEPAHSNQQRDGKGLGIKAHDFRVAALCHSSHALLDQGKSLSKEERVTAFDEAHRRTIGLLFLRGFLKPRTSSWGSG